MEAPAAAMGGEIIPGVGWGAQPEGVPEGFLQLDDAKSKPQSREALYHLMAKGHCYPPADFLLNQSIDGFKQGKDMWRKGKLYFS